MSGTSVEEVSEDDEDDVSVDDVNTDRALAIARAMAAETMATVDAELGTETADNTEGTPTKISRHASHPPPLVKQERTGESYETRSLNSHTLGTFSKTRDGKQSQDNQRWESQRWRLNEDGRRGDDDSDVIRNSSPTAFSPTSVPKSSSSFLIEDIIGTASTRTERNRKDDHIRDGHISSPSTPTKKPDIFDKIPSPPPKLFEIKNNTIDMSHSFAAVYPRISDPRYGGLAPAFYGGVAPAGHLAQLMYASVRGGAVFPGGFSHPFGFGHGAVSSLSYPYPQIGGGLDSNRVGSGVALSLASASAAASPLQRLSPH